MWKADCGFMNNYMVELHKRILINIPTFTKQFSSHIDSKLKWLKGKYHTITTMPKECGCKWNDIEYKIESFFHEGKEIPVRHNTTVSISDFLSDEDTINVYLDTSSVEKSFSEKLGRKFEQGYGLSNKDFDSVEFDNSRVICKDNKRGIIIVLARPMSNKFISSYLV